MYPKYQILRDEDVNSLVIRHCPVRPALTFVEQRQRVQMRPMRYLLWSVCSPYLIQDRQFLFTRPLAPPGILHLSSSKSLRLESRLNAEFFNFWESCTRGEQSCARRAPPYFDFPPFPHLSSIFHHKGYQTHIHNIWLPSATPRPGVHPWVTESERVRRPRIRCKAIRAENSRTQTSTTRSRRAQAVAWHIPLDLWIPYLTEKEDKGQSGVLQSYAPQVCSTNTRVDTIQNLQKYRILSLLRSSIKISKQVSMYTKFKYGTRIGPLCPNQEGDVCLAIVSALMYHLTNFKSEVQLSRWNNIPFMCMTTAAATKSLQ